MLRRPTRSSLPRSLAAAALALLAAAAGCDAGTPSARASRDTGPDSTRHGAARIVSLNPTTTELLFALGAADRLVGRSRWDEWPEAAKAIPDVGDGIRPNVEAVLAVRPQLVLLYASQDNRAAAARLRAAGVQTLSLKIDGVDDFRRATLVIGAATGRDAAARATVDSVDATLARVRRLTSGLPRPTVLWRAWESPLLVIGGGSFLDEIIDIAGGRNVFADLRGPSPQVSFEEVLRRDPDVVIAESGIEALRAHERWRALPAVRAGRFLGVDAAVVGRPSVRLGEAAATLARGLHPELADSLRARP